MHKLAVMVSLYNSGQWVESRLKNLLDTVPRDEIEIWCINSNSPDPRDHDIPYNLQPHVKYVRQPERTSVYESWNVVIQQSESRYLCNANSDDIVAPDCYQKLMSVLDKDKDIGFAYPSWYCTAKDNQQWPPIEVDPNGYPGNYMGDIERGGVGHFPLWRKSLHDKYGLFDNRFKALGDADFWARCYHKSKGKVRFFWLNEHLACYLWRDGSDGKERNLWHQMITADEWGLYHSNVQQYQT